MLISDEGSSELMRKEIFQTEIYKDLLEFLTPLFYKSQTLLIEVIWISINLTCIEDSKKLALLFKEKLIEKLIVLIKYDENNTILNPDVRLFKANKGG